MFDALVISSLPQQRSDGARNDIRQIGSELSQIVVHVQDGLEDVVELRPVRLDFSLEFGQALFERDDACFHVHNGILPIEGTVAPERDGSGVDCIVHALAYNTVAKMQRETERVCNVGKSPERRIKLPAPDHSRIRDIIIPRSKLISVTSLPPGSHTVAIANLPRQITK